MVALGVPALSLALSCFALISGVSSSPLIFGRLSNVIGGLVARKPQDIPPPAPVNTPFPIIGVKDEAGSIQPRLEIRDLQENKDQWNLYLLGVARMQAVSQDDKLSWYQIGGIHGMPFVPWDGVQPEAYPSIGYCVHDSNLFLPWHRPYVALFEQVLQTHVLAAAEEWPAGPDRDRYVAAAQTFRVPYWDWALFPPANQNNTPPVITDPTVDVTLPNGTTTIPNPLLSYTFHPLDGAALESSGTPQFSKYPSTLRYPTDLSATAISQENGVQQNMMHLRAQLRDALYDIFTNYNNFTLVSNMGSYHPSQYQSIEAVHGWVHNYVGGVYGNMLNVPWSAFDPIFMLHHTMVDRVFAIWQALYPDSYVMPENQDYPTYMIQQNTIQDADSPLAPFHSNTNGDFWTSSQCRNISTFYYTYPDLQSNDQAALKERINYLYGQSTLAHHTKRDDVNSVDAMNVVVDPKAGTVGAILAQPAQVDPTAVKRDLPRFEYHANFKFDKCALNGSGTMYFFLGNHSENSANWKTEPNLAGSAGLFININALAIGGETPLYGSVPLTRILEKKVISGELTCMYPSEVTPYLTKHLSWRMITSDGIPIAPENVSGLKISIVAAQYKSAGSDCDFPQRVSEYVTLNEITHNKPGGLRIGETV